ncbi:class I adenylate-forming enzyme family protein [Spelaeicoccus albus]|uniref:Acyl-CoA synthetase (AMP-forming)/AMP-acid ligase II n=1 Tax=Spelaeicoccus albus TaxID=1280376 RepID=A0A7Z0D584_9MICO|nr:AMP-binding protein [Spelaeicoccus albus]NYI69054.1 acyl-CoA synthetase (AMP-forming)/AMP-acid ligase II [Spelaeicoccus albus]
MTYDSSNFRNYFEHEFTYAAGFARNVARYGNDSAIVDPAGGRSWTYRELGADVDKLAAALAARGVGRGDRVVYQLFNGPEFAMFYLATQRIAAIGVPVNYRLAPGETAHILADSAPAVYAYDVEMADTAKAALASSGPASSGPAPALIAVGTPGGGVLPGAETFDDVLAGGDGAELPGLPADFSTYEETTRLYTSGTTGMPKGVALPSIVEVMSAHDVIMHFPIGPHDRTLNMTPWFHRGGLYSGGPNPLFYAGGSVVPMRNFDPATTLDWVSKYKITFLIGAPTTLAMIADEQERQPRDLTTLHGVVTMGAPLDKAAALRYQNLLTPRIFNGYGTTEAFWNTFLRPEDLPERAGTAGRACTDDDVAVVKVFDDRRATPDEVVARDGSEPGEIIMRSPKSGFAYVNLPEAQEEKFFHGWLYPGDIATWDEDGFVTILGRKDDMIISGGENVHPVQVESSLAEHPGVADAAVVGVADARWGQRIVAYVIRKDPAVTATELDKHCKDDDQLANFKRPRGYKFVDELPMTATGKKMHFKVAETAAADDSAGAFDVPASGA